MGAAARAFIESGAFDVIGLSPEADFAELGAPGGAVALQGNLDPQILVAGGAALDAAVDHIVQTLSAVPFIFNLGHGVPPETPIAHVEQMIARIRGQGD